MKESRPAKKRVVVSSVLAVAKLSKKNTKAVAKKAPKTSSKKAVRPKTRLKSSNKQGDTKKIKQKIVTKKTIVQPETSEKTLQSKKSLHSQLVLRTSLLPIELNTLAVHTARLAGVAFVIVGAFFITSFSSKLATFNAQSSVLTNNQVAQLAGTIPTSTQPTTVHTVSTASSSPNAYMELVGTSPLSGQVILRAIAPNAKKVDFYAFSGSWNNKVLLGSGTQVRADVWEFNWDTTKAPDDTNYRFTAYVWDVSLPIDQYDYQLQLINYYEVSNAPVQVSSSTTNQVTQTVLPDPIITVKAGSEINEKMPIYVDVTQADSVMLRAESVATGARFSLPDPKSTAASKWQSVWDTSNLAPGKYKIWARIITGGNSFTSTDVIVDVSSKTSTANPIPTQTTPPVLPTAVLDISNQNSLSGNVPMVITATNASYVNFFILDLASANPRFLGAATRYANSDRWYFNWYTNDVPNGSYKIFGKSVTPYGVIETSHVLVKVLNHFTPVKQINQSVVDDIKSISLAQPTPAEKNSSTTTSSSTSTTQANQDPLEQIYKIFKNYESDFQAELTRLAGAERSGDKATVARINSRLNALRDQVIIDNPNQFTEELKLQYIEWFNQRVSSFMDKQRLFTALIEQRQLVNILQDSDNDGITDYDEVAIYHTDPFVADTDGDGVIDGVEIMDGYDPLDSTREVPIKFDSPLEAGAVRDDVLSVDSVVSLTAPSSSTTTIDKAVAVFSGKGLPNSFVTLYFFSTPIIVTARTDEDGTWRYRFDKELEDGEHQVFVGITDNAGRIIAKSRPFGFFKQAEAISPSLASTINTQSPVDEHSFFSSFMIYLVLSISVVAIGLILLMLGLHLDTRRNKLPVITGSTPVV